MQQHKCDNCGSTNLKKIKEGEYICIYCDSKYFTDDYDFDDPDESFKEALVQQFNDPGLLRILEIDRRQKKITAAKRNVIIAGVLFLYLLIINVTHKYPASEALFVKLGWVSFIIFTILVVRLIFVYRNNDTTGL